MFQILIVDDDPNVLELTKLVLEGSKRFRVVAEAADADKGLAQAAKHQPDLVLLDLKMPGKSGFEVLPEIRRVAPRSRVVAFSMLHGEDNAQRALQLGAVGFVDKSADSDELVRRLLEILDGSAGAAHVHGRGGQRLELGEPLVRWWRFLVGGTYARPRPS